MTMAQQLLEIELTHGFNMSPGFVTLPIECMTAEEKIQVKFQRIEDVLTPTDGKKISDAFRTALAQAILFSLKTESRCVERGEIYVSEDKSTVNVPRLRGAGSSILPRFKDTFKDILSGMNSPDVQKLADDFCEKVTRRLLTVDLALNHPVFWSAAQKISFFKKTLHAIPKQCTSAPESMKSKDWIKVLHIDKDKVQDLNELNNMNGGLSIESDTIQKLAKYKLKKEHRTYVATSWVDFLAFFRNIHAHFWQQEENVRRVLRDENDGYWEFFSERFPGLLLEVYEQFKPLANSSNAREPKFLPDIYEKSKNRQQTVSKPDLGKWADKRKMQKLRSRTDR